MSEWNGARSYRAVVVGRTDGKTESVPLLTWKADLWESAASTSLPRDLDDDEAFLPRDGHISSPCTADRIRDRWCPGRDRGSPEPKTVAA